MLEAYVDESANKQLMCVGGWLGRDFTFDRIEEAWDRRISYEQNLSVKQGFKPIERYHANYCSNFKREFSRENGWDETRQIKLTKRLINILTDNGVHNPAAIVFGGAKEDYLRYFPESSEDWEKALYFFSLVMCFYEIASLVKGTYPNERVNIFYERGKFGGAVNAALDYIKRPENIHVGRYIITAVPVGWEDCTAIQSADFMAYEGYKRVGGTFSGRETIRKSLQTLLGNGRTTLIIGHFKEDTFRKMFERKRRELRELGIIK